MDLNKSYEFFDPSKVKKTCHVIGCGSIGSNVAELLVRQGVENITLWDMDVVESHNVVNQIYTSEDINKLKTEALAEYLYKINPRLKETITIRKRYNGQPLSGFIFLCVDSVEVRHEIVKKHMPNESIEAMFDFRTTLEEGQIYFADWTNDKHKTSLLNSLDFTHEEAQANTPVSACGFELSVAPVVKMTAQMGIVNFTNLINNVTPKVLTVVRPYDYIFEAY